MNQPSKMETTYLKNKAILLDPSSTDEEKDNALYRLANILDEDEFASLAIQAGLNNWR